MVSPTETLFTTEADAPPILCPNTALLTVIATAMSINRVINKLSTFSFFAMGAKLPKKSTIRNLKLSSIYELQP